LVDELKSSATPASLEVNLSLKKALISLTAFVKLFVDSYLLQEIVKRKIRIALCSMRLTVARRRRFLVGTSAFFHLFRLIPKRKLLRLRLLLLRRYSSVKMHPKSPMV
jgi:hypothetical protein